mgnify:CR=1 FL=1
MGYKRVTFQLNDVIFKQLDGYHMFYVKNIQFAVKRKNSYFC